MPSEAQILLDRIRSEKKNEVGVGTSLIRGVGEKLVDNALFVPEFLARGGQGVMNLGRAATGQPMQKRQGNLLDLPSGRDVLSAVDMIGGDQSFDQARTASDQSAELNPMATGLGNAMGDALTVFRGAANLGSSALGQFGKRGAGDIANRISSIASSASPGIKKITAKTLDSKAVKGLAKAAGRSLETGVEGAAVSILQDGDPLETAAWSAGGQLAGSLFLGAGSGIISRDIAKTGLNIAVLAAASGSLLQMVKNVTPGGQDSILDSIESGYDKIIFALILGGISGVLGAGRVGGDIAENLPIFAKAITALPRVSTISLIREISGESERGNEVPERTLELLASNPDVFSAAQIKVLEKAITSEKFSFSEEVSKLLDDDKFRAIIEAPDPRLAGVPFKKDDS